MHAELLISLLSSVVALVSAGFTIWGQSRLNLQKHQLEKQRLLYQEQQSATRHALSYLEPLARAAYDLQSCFYNILYKNLIEVCYTKGDRRSQSYILSHTTFLIAQYFAISELIRRDLQFINLSEDARVRTLLQHQREVSSLFKTDLYDKSFRFFVGEQRAIGEVMISEDSLRLISYSAFLQQIERHDNPLVRAIQDDIQSLADNLSLARPRMTAIQHSLINLIDFLDPDCVRFPEKSRTKA